MTERNERGSSSAGAGAGTGGSSRERGWAPGGTLHPSGTHYDSNNSQKHHAPHEHQQRRRHEHEQWIVNGPNLRKARATGQGGPSAGGPKLQSSNVGFRLLQKAGWKPGQGLGKDGEGAVVDT
jgi:hypothetical protein